MAYGLKTKGGHKTKNPQARDEFRAGKKLGRKKQVYVYDNGHSWSGPGQGHWEKVK